MAGVALMGESLAMCTSRSRDPLQGAQKKRNVNRRNPYRISIEDLLRKEGRSVLEIAHATICRHEPAPALCMYACRVEMEGTCKHGCASVLKTLMIRGLGWNEIPGDPVP
jgi:hypothetical protein